MVFVGVLQSPRVCDLGGTFGIWAHDPFFEGFGALKIDHFGIFGEIMQLMTSEIEAAAEMSIFVRVSHDKFHKRRNNS